MTQKIIYFKDRFPEAFKMLHPVKNEGIDLDKIPACSRKKYWFLLPYDDEVTGNHFDFEWECSTEKISANKGLNCPYLSGHKVWIGFNDFSTRASFALDYWNYEKNDFKPTDITYASSKIINFKCKLEHEWTKTAHSVYNDKYCFCPECSKKLKTSYNETAVYFYIKKVEPNSIWTYREKGFELDIFIPNKNIGVEYDGKAWHKNIKRDIKKNNLCKDNSITLYRIREVGCPKLNSSSVDIQLQSTNKKELASVIHDFILNVWEINIDVDIDRDNMKILGLYKTRFEKNSIQDNNYKLLALWNYEKNFPLTPENISLGSNQKIWWKGKCNHEWQRSPNVQRISKGCPFCLNQELLEGFNDLETKFPKVAKKWDYEKNFPLTPKMVFPKSNKKMWWICNEGHSYCSSINSQTKGSKCNICLNKVILTGYNDFASNYPNLLVEWDFRKNKNINPEKIACNSHLKVNWVCEFNHEWKSSIDNRVSKNSGCPDCYKLKRKQNAVNEWNNWYLLLLECLEFESIENIHYNYVYKNKNLGNWCRAQRRNFNKGVLSEEQINKLKDLKILV